MTRIYTRNVTEETVGEIVGEYRKAWAQTFLDFHGANFPNEVSARLNKIMEEPLAAVENIEDFADMKPYAHRMVELPVSHSHSVLEAMVFYMHSPGVGPRELDKLIFLPSAKEGTAIMNFDDFDMNKECKER